MKAMILAAGPGTRLRPLTDAAPKALIDIGGGVTMLEHVAQRLIRAGVGELIINASAHADRIEEFVRGRGGFGVRVQVSREEVPLESGGGLRQAAWFFDDDQPFFVHNVDVVTDVDLRTLYRAHIDNAAYATLAVAQRPDENELLFDASDRLCGRADLGRVRWSGGPMPMVTRYAFSGIQAVSPKLLRRMTEKGAFPLTDTYLRLAKSGLRISPFRCDGRYWAHVGTREGLERVRRHSASVGLPT